MSNPDPEILETRPDSEEGLGLILALDAELRQRYPNGAIHTLHPKDLEDPRLIFLIARIEGRAVGCGGVRELERGAGEVKRMFVIPGYRGRGIARRLLASLEHLAQARGYSVLRLETGARQPEAIALHEAAGYRKIAPFGEYVGDPDSICFEKQLPTSQEPRIIGAV